MGKEAPDREDSKSFPLETLGLFRRELTRHPWERARELHFGSQREALRSAGVGCAFQVDASGWEHIWNSCSSEMTCLPAGDAPDNE